MPKEKILSQDRRSVQKSEEFGWPNFQNEPFRSEDAYAFSARYKIIKDLGEGGIGRVYKAYDLWNRKEIALKILVTAKENPLFWESFKNEFLLLTQLRHPGVVEVFDFGYTKPSGWTEPTNDLVQLDHLQGEVPYFTMEFVEGKTLHQSFDLPNLKDSALPQSEKLYHFIWQICDILEYLHLRGIVHCDLKPDNIKITDRVFDLKLLDFGLSEVIGAKRKKTTKGTLSYMAPEMFSDEPLDEKTDLYSLGVILYELVTSKPPFLSEDPMKIVSGHLERLPASPKELNPWVNESLNQLILNLLEKSPDKRPQSASQVKMFATKQLKENRGTVGRKTFLAHLYSGELVARETEETCVGQLLKEIISSEGRTVLLAGEQGVGKSSLLRDLRIRSQLEGTLYVDSNCLEDQTKAYQPLIEILRKIKPYLEEHGPRLPHGAELAKEKFDQASGSIIQKHKGRSFSLSCEQSSAHQKIIESLIEISHISPLVLVIDNLQWADFQTLRFLSQFGQNVEKSKILLACAFRPEEIKEESPLKQLIDGWKEMRWCSCIRLDRFDYQRTVTFIRSKLKRERFPKSFFSYMHQNTSGNPFFLTEVLKYLLEKKIILMKDCGWEVDSERLRQTVIPDSMEAVLSKNLEKYNQKTLDLLSTVAVIGKRFDPELVGKLNLFAEKDLFEILFILVKDQVFIKRESLLKGRPYYEFANQSLQSLLYQRFDEKKKVKVHGRIAKLLEERGLEEDDETVFEIGHHYLKSHQHEKAYQYALLSAEKMAQRFANQEVLEYLGTAVGTTSKFRDKEEGKRKKVEALMRRADFHKQIGELNQALKDYKTILRLTKNTPHLKMIAEAYNDLGDTYRLKHDYKRGLSCLKKALEIRQKLGDPLPIANTLHNMGIIYWIDSQYQQALISFEKALKIYERLGNKFYIASTLNGMGELHRICHRYKQAKRLLQEALKIKQELGNKEEMARGLNNLGATHFDLGEYDQAINYYLESLKLNEQIKNKKEIVYNLVNLGETYQKIGDFGNALKYSQKGLELAANIDFTQAEGHILKNLGVTNFELGHYQKAYEYFQQSKGISEKIIDKELQIAVLLEFSRFYVTLNDDRKANSLLQETATLINTIDDDKSLISVYQIKSRLSQKEENFEEALKLLDQATDLAKKLRAPEELLSLNLEYSKLHLNSGNIEKTKEFLRKAWNCGLSRYILFQPEFYLISGKKGWMSGDLSSAKENLETALQLAEKLQNPELIRRIHHHLGKFFLSLNHIERAYQELEKAGKILKRVSENIKDDEWKQNYLKDREKKELLSDLKEVAKDLAGETKIT